ncbi:MAG: diguanylate cyclase [Acidimicrobiia bacterium]
MAPPARETAGTTIRLIVHYVRHHAGDDGVTRLLELAGETRPLADLEDERHWSTYEQKIALMEAAAVVLDDPDVTLHIGEAALDEQVGSGIRLLLRHLGSPRVVLANVAKACPKFSTVATMTAEDLGRDHAVVTYHLDDDKVPHRLDCLLNIGFMRTIGPIFGMPPLAIEHPTCQVEGAPECRYVVEWENPRGRRKQAVAEGRALRHQVAELEAQLALLQSTTADLVSPDDIDLVLARIVSRAGTSVSATRYLLALYDDVAVNATAHADGIAEDEIEAATAAVLAAPLGVDSGRIVIEVASSRRAYGRLAAFYDQHQFFPAEEGMLATYARSAAVALDAATALDELRRRNAATDALLQLARSLAVPATSRRIARTVASAMTEILEVPATAVMLWDESRAALRVVGRSGWPAETATFVDAFELPVDDYRNLGRLLEIDGARVIEPSAESANPIVRNLRVLGFPQLAVAPIRSHHGESYGLAIAAVESRKPRRIEAVVERLVAISDQTATAVQNAELLEQIRHQAVHDNLTGLANRALFDDDLDKTLARAHRDGHAVTVLFIDLDDFKTVNDRFGHGAGDHVLRTVAARLVDAGRKGDSVARLGGDEFTMLLPGASRATAEHVAARVREAIRVPIVLGEELLTINASVGIASTPDDGESADALLRTADRSMYRRKRTERIPTAVAAAPRAPAAAR